MATIGLGVLLARPVQASLGNPPAELGAHRVVFRSDSGADVRGWWAPAAAARGTILLLPGVRANRHSMLDRALFLRSSGYSVLLIDLQATGETRGDLITFGWRERLDVLAAVDFMRRVAPGSKVAIIGMSLGGAAALLATPPLDADALVLEAVYPSITRAVENRLAIRLGSMGRRLAPLLLVQLRPRIGVGTDALRPIDHISQVRCPVLVIGGTADQHTTVHDSLELYGTAKAPKQLWLVPGASHVDIHRAHTAEYEARILNFLSQSFATQNASVRR